MGQKVIITGGRRAGRSAAQALLAALAAKGFEGEEIEIRHEDRSDFPEVPDVSAHPYGNRAKPKRRRLKRKGSSKL